ncbi:MAG: cytochrome c biogenesis protein CcsA [Anaerolineae bacterium]|nr:cytochrome c biogenesis protein CcsA [Anaerolineae bacterium]
MAATKSIDTAELPPGPVITQAPMPRALVVLTILTIAGVILGLYMALGYAGTEIEQGDVQRIFYIHMPAFFGAFFAFAATTIGGLFYLRTRNPRWDTLALAGVEVGLVLALINLTTGAIWARPIWNTWWNWDPRLTAEAVMVLTYAAYLMLRAGMENPEQRRRFAAVYGIFAIATAIITLMIPRIVEATIHPVVIAQAENAAANTMAEGGFELAATAGVGAALGINIIIWGMLVPITLIWHRIRLENHADRIRALKMRLMES